MTEIGSARIHVSADFIAMAFARELTPYIADGQIVIPAGDQTFRYEPVPDGRKMHSEGEVSYELRRVH